MYAVQFAKALGYRVVAIDNRKEGRALAGEVPLPADLVVDYNDKDSVTKIKEWAGRDGVAAVLVTTDNIEATHWSLEILRPRGICVPIGLPVEGFKFSAFNLIFQEKIIKGSLVASRNEVEDMMAIVAKYGIRGHVKTVTFEEGVNFPELYLDAHLKGRLVLKI